MQIAVEIRGVGAADALANAELLDAGGSVVASAALTGDVGIKGGDIEVSALAGDYELTVTVSDNSNQVLAVTSRRLVVNDAVDVPLELERVEPIEGQDGVEPNSFITLYFNPPIDLGELTLNVHETAHGFTYQDQDELGTSVLHAKGYQLVEANRNYDPVPGSLSLLPGDRMVAFYPGQELAYGDENSGLASITATSDQYPGVTMAVMQANNHWSVSVPLELGINLITLTALDQAGNSSHLT